MFLGLEMLHDDFPNKSLEEKILLFQKDENDKNYLSVLQELEKSVFLFPVLSKNSNIEGFVLTEINNNKYVSVFSNMSEFNKWYKDYELNFLFYNINEICSIINDKENDIIDGFIIDPYGLNMVFDKNLIKRRFSE